MLFTTWRKFFIQNNYDLSLLRLFKPVYLILTLLGLFPYCVKFKTKHNCVIIPRTIYLNCMCAVSVMLLMSVFGSIQIENMVHEITMANNSVMTQVNYIIEVIVLVASCFIAYICMYYYRYKIVNILNAMASAWVELRLSQNHNLEKLRTQIVYPLISLSILLIMHILINFTRKEGLWKKILVTFSFILPQMIQFVALTFYYVLVHMLVALLTNIEEALKSLKINKTALDRIGKLERRATPLLRTIEIVYVKAFEIKQDINDTFQATILLTCIQCFHAIVSEAHIIYHGVIVTSVLTTHEIINFSVWIVYQLIKIYALAYSGNLLNTVTCRIGRALHNIPPEKQDLRTLIEIQHFSSLMSHQTTDLTVYRYFPLDASFLFKIIASAAMYLIILVQFDKKN